MEKVLQSLSPGRDPCRTIPPNLEPRSATGPSLSPAGRGQQNTRRGSPGGFSRHSLSLAKPYILYSNLSIISSGSACTITEVPREEVQRGQRDALSLLHVERPAAPALAHRPFAHRPLAAKHVPCPGADRASVPAQRLHRLLHASPRMELGARSGQARVQYLARAGSAAPVAGPAVTR